MANDFLKTPDGGLDTPQTEFMRTFLATDGPTVQDRIIGALKEFDPPTATAYCDELAGRIVSEAQRAAEQIAVEIAAPQLKALGVRHPLATPQQPPEEMF